MVEVIKKVYLETMSKHYHENLCSGPWTRQWMQDIIQILIKNDEVTNTKWNIYDRDLKDMYMINQLEDKNFELVRILKSASNTVNLVPVIPWEDSFEIIWNAHLAAGHGNLTETMNLIKTNYFINIVFVAKLINICNCQKETIVSDIVHYNIEGSLHILDMRSYVDKQFNYVLIYNDTRTDLIQLRPLVEVNELEICLELVNIFTDLGPPRTVVVFEAYFYDHVIENVNKVFSPCRIELKLDIIEKTYAKKYHQVSTMLDVWMKMNKSTNWALGCYFVQWKMNVTISDNKIPYHIVFSNGMFGAGISKGCKVAKDTSNTVPKNIEINNETIDDTETCMEDVNIDNEKIEEIELNKLVKTEFEPEILPHDDEIETDVSCENKHDKMIETTFVCWRCQKEVNCCEKIQDSLDATETICQSCIKEEDNIT